MMHIAIFVFLIIFSVVGTVGNLSLIVVICCVKELRRHICIVNLAVADLLILVYIIPMGLVSSQFTPYPFSKLFCDINALLTTISHGASIQGLMLIAIERYYYITRPASYQTMFTTKRIAVYICIIWSYNVLWSAQGFTAWTEYCYAPKLYICTFGGKFSLSYDICFAFFCIFFPVMASVVYYALIFITMHRSKNALRRHRSNSLSRREA